MSHILAFLNEVLDNHNKRRSDIMISDLLPIFTASLGSKRENYVIEFCKFLGTEHLNTYLVEQITGVLNLDDKVSDRPQKILYSLQEKDRDLEQEIKLLSRMVQLCTQNLGAL